MGGNDDLNDAVPTASTNVVQLWDLTTQTLLASATGVVAPGADFNQWMSFAWLTKPTGSSAAGSFVVGQGAWLQKFSFNLTNPPANTTMSAGASLQVLPTDAVGVPFPAIITSVDTPVLKDGGTNQVQRIVFSTSSGRIFVIDTDLGFLRYFDQSDPNTNLPKLTYTYAPWPSNRTLAQTFTCDLAQRPAGEASLYFAEYAHPAWFKTAGKHYRLARVDLNANAVNWDQPSIEEAINDSEVPAWEALHPAYNRKLIYRDLDSNGTPERHLFAESGTAYVDDVLGLREFQTSSYWAQFLFPPPSTPSAAELFFQGGRVFELQPGRNLGNSSRNGLQYGYLGNFWNPTYTGMPYKNFSGSNSNGWWYQTIGPNFLTGQIANHSQSSDAFGLGASMSHAWIKPTASATRKRHVVVGTDNGFVFAIEPGSQALPAGGGLVNSNLNYASQNLGSYVIGLDVGNLDNDDGQAGDDGANENEEIVCGVWIDDGTYVDWTNNNANNTKNRAHLFILDPVPGGGGTAGFTTITLDGDDLCGAGKGIGSGVTGVKLDDVNGDGQKEIWCSDAAGHLYLFKFDTSTTPAKWVCRYRSDDHIPYQGSYNNIFPIKNDDAPSRTYRLLVVSPGYMVCFEVDWTKV